MIYFVRSYVSDFDARLGKYFGALDAAGMSRHFVGWNKDGAAASTGNQQTLFGLKARLGGGWRNALALLKWNLFLFWQLCRARRDVRVVHAIDLDSALSCWVFCKLFRKPLVFDIYDKYTAVRNISGLTGRVLDAVENHIANAADLTLIVSEDRFAQHGLRAGQPNIQILENVPGMAPVARKARDAVNPPWKIGYFGVLEPRNRGLEDLLAACKERRDVELHVAGYGGLAEAFSTAAGEAPNIHYYGPLASQEGLTLMAGMDVIVGMYYLTVPNHAFASPNKYYEHLMLGRGMLTTLGTPPGAKVARDGSGWAIAEGVAEVHAWLDRLNQVEIKAAGIQAGRVWSEKYSSYYVSHYKGEYVRRIKMLLGEG